MEEALEELGLEAEPNLAPDPEAEAEAEEPEPEPEECAICLTDLEEGPATRLVCTHTFHAVCLARWKDKCLEKGLQFTCAMCRGVVVVARV